MSSAPPWTDEDVTPPESTGASACDPLHGLDHLDRVALVGRDRILAAAQQPVAYVWQDIAVAGTIVLLAGGPSEGKTTLLFLVIVARANLGAPVSLLGRQVEPAPTGRWVVLIEGEHGEASTARKLVKSCALLGADDRALDRVIIIARKAVRIGSHEWEDVARMVAVSVKIVVAFAVAQAASASLVEALSTSPVIFGPRRTAPTGDQFLTLPAQRSG